MTKKFTPINYLDESDKRLLSRMKISIENAKTTEEVNNYKKVLDYLLDKAAKNYYKDQNNLNSNEKDLQHA